MPHLLHAAALRCTMCDVSNGRPTRLRMPSTEANAVTAISLARSSASTDKRLSLADPDVAEEDWVAMVLQLDGLCVGALGGAAASLGGDLDTVMDDHAIVQDGDARVLGLAPRVIEAGRAKIDVVG